MVDYDRQNDVLPQNPTKNPKGVKPTITELKAALTTFNATSYSAARLLSMTENDCIFACKQHGLTVNGL